MVSLVKRNRISIKLIGEIILVITSNGVIKNGAKNFLLVLNSLIKSIVIVKKSHIEILVLKTLIEREFSARISPS